MLALQKTKGKRGGKLKSKLINVTCQTEATATYMQYNHIYCDCRKRDNSINRKQIFKILRKYFAGESSNKHKKCSLLRYIKRNRKHINNVKTKSDNSVIYVRTKKLKSKKAIRNLSRKSVIYIGTTYNTFETRQHNDIIDLTQAEPATKITRKEKSARTSTEKPSLFPRCLPKTTTKYCKRPLFNSISDSVLFVKSKKLNDLKRKYTKSEYSVYLHKKFKPDLIEKDRNMYFKELMSIKLPSISIINETIDTISTDLVDISENTVSNITESSEIIFNRHKENETCQSIKDPNLTNLKLSSAVADRTSESDHYNVNETMNENVSMEINTFVSKLENRNNILEVIDDAAAIQENLEYHGITSDESNLPQQRMHEDSAECTLIESILTMVTEDTEDMVNVKDQN